MYTLVRPGTHTPLHTGTHLQTLVYLYTHTSTHTHTCIHTLNTSTNLYTLVHANQQRDLYSQQERERETERERGRVERDIYTHWYIPVCTGVHTCTYTCAHTNTTHKYILVYTHERLLHTCTHLFHWYTKAFMHIGTEREKAGERDICTHWYSLIHLCTPWYTLAHTGKICVHTCTHT